MKKLVTLLGSAALIVTLAVSCGEQQVMTDSGANMDTSSIKIGWVGPLTGDLANIGSAMKDSVEMGVKEVNLSGGIDGRMIEIVYEDGKCDSGSASKAGNKLINVDKVVAILGGTCSGETLAIAPVAEKNKVVMLSAASTAPAVSDAGDYIFRNLPSDAFQGKAGAEFVYNHLGKKKVAVVYQITDYTQGLATAFMDNFKALGGEVVVEDKLLQSDRDLKTQLTKVKNSDAELLYFVAYTESAVVGLKQAKELGLDVVIMGTDTFADPKVQEADGAEGVYYSVPSSEDSAEFTKRYLEETGREDMPAYVTQSYDALMMIVNAMKKVGVEGEKIKDELYNVKDYKGVSGMITLDEKGDLATAVYDINLIKGGKAELFKKTGGLDKMEGEDSMMEKDDAMMDSEE